ncbi:MAG: heme-binding protein [Methylobacteriaceae bacterium]|nr:heme-binding protein [Methylobacteriaceae bacterium]MBV9702274.1 heme-binding protein [Methylobacteriaceae bacterium]
MTRSMTAIAIALIVGSTVPVRADDIVTSRKLAWRLAAELAHKAVEICEGQGYSVTAAVVDSSGLEQALVKSDNAHPQSVTIAYRKAYTAFAYGGLFGYERNGDLIAARKELAAGPLNTVPAILFVAGGVTIRAGQAAIGGLGVSGAPGGDKDEACAAAALDTIRDRLK